MNKKVVKKKSFKRWLSIILGVIIVILVYFSISLYIAGKLVTPHRSQVNVSPTLVGSDYENITMTGADNITLKGWFFHAPSNKLIIFIHGVTQNRVNEGYYTILIARELLAQGYNILLYDSRAHGESGGDEITYGIKESQDIINVVDFAKTKGFGPNHVGIIANSLGAISLLMASDHLQNVGALIADSPADHIRPVLAGVLQREYHVPSFFNSGIFLLMKFVYHVDIDAVKPLDHIAVIPERKFLFLHGALDQTIPVTDSKELLKQANPRSQLIIFPNGSHIETYKSNPQKYRGSLYPFLEEELK